jgi:hypothetical protein
MSSAVLAVLSGYESRLGGDAASIAKNAVMGTIEAAKEIGGQAGDAIRKAVSGTIAGVTIIVKEPFKKEK